MNRVACSRSINERFSVVKERRIGGKRKWQDLTYWHTQNNITANLFIDFSRKLEESPPKTMMNENSLLLTIFDHSLSTPDVWLSKYLETPRASSGKK